MKVEHETRPMAETAQQLKTHLDDGLQLLRTLRDELRVELHLAGMEAKTQWEEQIEPKFARAEGAVLAAQGNAREAVDDAIHSLKLFREFVRGRKKA